MIAPGSRALVIHRVNMALTFQEMNTWRRTMSSMVMSTLPPRSSVGSIHQWFRTSNTGEGEASYHISMWHYYSPVGSDDDLIHQMASALSPAMMDLRPGEHATEENTDPNVPETVDDSQSIEGSREGSPAPGTQEPSPPPVENLYVRLAPDAPLIAQRALERARAAADAGETQGMSERDLVRTFILEDLMAFIAERDQETQMDQD